MAERNWTNAQQAAIGTYGKTLLVSAAAGSGKTAALTERIIRRLTDTEHPADISRMLIVTFTRAAAGELRERISGALTDALAKNPTSRHLSEQIVRLSEAHISTIDSFSLEIVRSNFASLSLPPNFRMADEAELAVLQKSVMENLINQSYKKDPAFGHFSDHFSGVRDDRALADTFLSIYKTLLSYPDGILFLQKNAERLKEDAGKDYFSSSFGKVSASRFADFLENAVAVLGSASEAFSSSEVLQKQYLPAFQYDLDFLKDLLSGVRAGAYETTRQKLAAFSPKRLGAVRGENATRESIFYKGLRTSFHKELKRLSEALFRLPECDIARAMRDSAEVSEKLCSLLTSYDERIGNEKRSRGICDFDDIRRYTYHLLVTEEQTPTPLAKSIAERFDEIYIDEYQDVDRVQDLIFSSIATPTNRFLVGDIKQSIYSFRGAEPAVFAGYRKRFPTYGTEECDKSDAEAIYMSENFRCDPPVIDFTNRVTGALFPACGERLSYRKEDDLIAAKALPESYTPSPVEILLVTHPKEEEKEEEEEVAVAEAEDPQDSSTLPTDTGNAEANLIVSKIRTLLKEGKKADGSPLSYGDIAILARAKSTLSEVKTALGEAGIPHVLSVQEDFFQNPDVLLLLCLLNVIDNPRRDIYLTGLLRSPLYLFSLEELVKIRMECDESFPLYDAVVQYADRHGDNACGEKCTFFLSELSRYRASAAVLPVDRLLRIIFKNPRLLSKGTPLSNPHLLHFYEYARSFESGAFRGLYRFISYITRLIEEKTRMELPPEQSSENAVRLMTIHQSKGLEFPVCILAGSGKGFNLSDSKDSLLLSQDIGAAMKLSDESGFGRINTPMRDAIAAHITDCAIEEEMRVLYVALTRAREKLIVTAKLRSDGEKAFKTAEERAAFPSRYSVMSCRSYIEWILYARAIDGQSADAYSAVSSYPDSEIPLPAKSVLENGTANSEKLSEVPSPEAVSRAKEQLLSAFSYVYPYQHLSKLPAKLSVSSLFPGVLDENEDAAVLPGSEPPSPSSSGTSGQDAADLAAQQGTATHCFLQFCNFQNARRYGAEAECKRLVAEKFLSPDTANLCRIEELDAFFQSDLFRSILRAKKVYREQRFNIFLPARNFTRDDAYGAALGEEKILVQGVIDLFYFDENDRLILCDYKTDRLTKEERRDDEKLREKMYLRHGEQLSYYVLALEQLLGRRPDRVLVYATAASRAVELKF